MSYKLNPFTSRLEFSRNASAIGSASGGNTQVQYNNGGGLGASGNLTFDSSTNTLAVGGNITVSGTVDGVDVSALSTSVTTLDAQNVKLTGDQTVAGVKTFSSFPVTPSSYPTSDYQASNKKYVDDYQHHWTEIQSGETVTIPVRRQMTVHGDFINDGILVVDGSFVNEI
jgi:hypothetical protein